jgi:hypothetical protein
MLNGARVVGGGPATTSRGGEALTDLSASKSNPETAILNEMAHLHMGLGAIRHDGNELLPVPSRNPNNEARVRAIQSGEFRERQHSHPAGLGHRQQNGNGWTWNAEAFNELGEVKSETLRIQDPTNANCAACHGEVHADDTPLTSTPATLTIRKPPPQGRSFRHSASTNRAST